jgi:hypothetical protein
MWVGCESPDGLRLEGGVCFCRCVKGVFMETRREGYSHGLARMCAGGLLI